MTKLEDLYRQRARLEAEIAHEEAAEARRARRPLPTTGAVIAATADLYGVTVEQVLSDARAPRVVKARQAACWVLRAQGWTFQGIGRALDRDHSTVIHACNKIDADAAARGLLWRLLDRSQAVA